MEKKEEIIITDEEKMKKKIKLFKNIASLGEGLLMLPVISAILVLIIGSGQFIFYHQTTFLGEIVKEFSNDDYILYTENETELTWENINLLANQFTKNKDSIITNFNFANETIKNITSVLVIIFVCLDYILYVLMLDKVIGIFNEILKNGTPFTENSVKNMRKIRLLSIILIFIGMGPFSIGLMPVIIISALTLVFGYGYKLQIESDETL